MRIEINHRCTDYDSYRSARVKSLFNAESGANFNLVADLPIDDQPWQIGLVVGPSGSGKTSVGERVFGSNLVHDLYAGWPGDKPIIDAIAPQGDFNAVTGSLAGVGLGDVPVWLRPFPVLSNGQKYRAGLARLLCEAPGQVVVDEFTSVVDRQIAQIGAMAFAKAWRRLPGNQIVLLSCHYDVAEWLQPDWIYDTAEARFARDCLRRPRIDLKIWKVNQHYWRYFKPHYYLDLPMPPAAEYFVGTVNDELVCHVAVAPLFTANAYRATRLVVMPEWQGAGAGTKFLEWVAEYHMAGNGRCGKQFGTLFHTSHPQLIQYLLRSPKWILKSQQLYGGNKAKSASSINRTMKSGKYGGNDKVQGAKTGYGGHFRAVQGFKYIGTP